jgi:hypothetical protein
MIPQKTKRNHVFSQAYEHKGTNPNSDDVVMVKLPKKTVGRTKENK